MSRYEADLAASVVSINWSSMGYMQSTTLPNMELYRICFPIQHVISAHITTIQKLKNTKCISNMTAYYLNRLLFYEYIKQLHFVWYFDLNGANCLHLYRPLLFFLYTVHVLYGDNCLHLYRPLLFFLYTVHVLCVVCQSSYHSGNNSSKVHEDCTGLIAIVLLLLLYTDILIYL
jgi:hypothetical protein